MIFHKREDSKEKIKRAWAAGDFISLFQAGVDSFMSLTFDHPLPFQTFLDYTSSFIDRFILDTERQEHLQCAGGKLLLELESDTIRMVASIYFQDRNKNWILKEKIGQVDPARFSDWDNAPELADLRKSKSLEFPITPPENEAG